MKKLFTFFLLLHIMNVSMAQKEHQFDIGMENSEFGYLQYIYKSHWLLKATHSIFVEKIKFQTIKFAVGYRDSLNEKLNVTICPMFQTSWGGTYQAFGLKSECELLMNVCSIDAGLMPYYDSSIGYKTCYTLGAAYRICDKINFGAHLTNIPEYRDIYNRINFSLRFEVCNLSVSPTISMPIFSKYSKARILINFNYKF